VRPDQQRIRSIRRAEVAVSGALDHEPQALNAREVDRRGDVLGALRGDGVDARRRRPRVEPSGELRAARLLGEEIRILHFREPRRARGARRRIQAGREGRLHRNQASADRLPQLLPPRRRRPAGIGGARGRRPGTPPGKPVQKGKGRQRGKSRDAFQELASVHERRITRPLERSSSRRLPARERAMICLECRGESRMTR
jgi:hypothetical protein